MTGRIIHLPGDVHREIQSLLPWYLTDTLDEIETARVRAHLGQCAECQGELRNEQRLATEVSAAPVDAGTFDADHGWKQINRLMEQESQVQHSARRRAASGGWRDRLLGHRARSARPQRTETPWLRGAVAAQFCLLMVLGVAVLRPAQPARYHALGAAPVDAAGNVVVIFRPETPEKELRQILKANDARLVGGPTEADAYLLHVPAAGRAAAQ
ncbi:MAG: zf-HC2 domain-containing protein, partial [Caulobacteraceae bacterium]